MKSTYEIWSKQQIDNYKSNAKMILKKVYKTAKGLYIRNEYVCFSVLKLIAKYILPRYRFKWPQMVWWDNRRFNRYLAEFDEINGMNTDRRWMLLQLLRLVDCVPGDTAECGVYKGSSSYLICNANQAGNANSRHHYMFDSFEGLSTPSRIDGEHWTEGDLSVDANLVMENLAGFKNIHILKGWIPTRFPEVQDNRFAFAHVDVDLYEPTYESIKFFYPRLNPGGILVCDDYGFTSCPGATKAADDFLEDKEEKMISLSCGGGFFIKGIHTAN